MRYVAVAVTCSLAVFLSGSTHLGAQEKTTPTTQRALLDKYCVTCHNQRLKTANVTFDTMDLNQLSSNAQTWERAVRKLRGGMIPPPGAPRPDAAAVDTFVTWLENSLDKAAAAHPNPGSVTLHRLNRAEYANAMRELFAIDVDPAALLPTDDISDGFDNIANVLKVSPSFLDQYITAARAVTRQAVGEPMAAGPLRVALRGGNADGVVPPGTRGTAIEHVFPADGEYEFTTGGAAGGGGGRGGGGRGGRGGGPAPGAANDANGPVVTVDGTRIALNSRINLTAGAHLVSVSTPARGFTESDALLQSLIPNTAGPAYGAAVRGAGGAATPTVTVVGPYNPPGPVQEIASPRKIFICQATTPADETSWATQIFSNIARRAFRRPVTDKDVEAPVAFFKQARATDNFERSVEAGLIAILASPKFLYRAEPPPANAKAGTSYRISDVEMASRLSFFLWSSIPDETLLKTAEQGKLKDPAVLEQQVRRMLADPRAKSLVTNFAFEWLRVREINSIDPDAFIYPSFDANLRNAFRREMELWVGSVFGEDRNVTELLTSNYSYLNERLATHYG